MFTMSLFVNSLSAEQSSNAVIVLDGSGSMWGKVEGKTKISIAKATIKELVVNWDQRYQLGLLSYGHRRKSDCNDIEVLAPIGKINKEDVISVVSNISPKGKTPLSASLKMAADELKNNGGNGSIILISDGEETCSADPCAVAAELKQQQMQLVAHVIGFDVNDQQGEQLRCIASATGGQYLPAKNAPSLDLAMSSIVETITSPEAPTADFLVRSCLDSGVTEKKCRCLGDDAVASLDGGLLDLLRLAPANDIVAAQAYYSRQEVESIMDFLKSTEAKCEIE